MQKKSQGHVQASTGFIQKDFDRFGFTCNQRSMTPLSSNHMCVFVCVRVCVGHAHRQWTEVTHKVQTLTWALPGLHG